MAIYFGRLSPSARRYHQINLILFCLVGVSIALFGWGTFVLFTRHSGDDPAVPIVIEKEKAQEMVDVLVPKNQIEAGRLLEPSMFERQNRAAKLSSPGLIHTFEEIQGAYSRTLIPTEQPVHKDFLTRIKPVNTVTANIPDGFRAVTINVDATSSVEGWARAGSRVDVMWIGRVRGEAIATVIVENAKLLSVERETTSDQNVTDILPSTVTLLVSMADSEKIQLAKNAGALNLMLRGDRDTGKADTAGGTITVSNLMEAAKGDTGAARPKDMVKIRASNGKNVEYQLEDDQLVPKGASEDS